jgi:hypothetical protein
MIIKFILGSFSHDMFIITDTAETPTQKKIDTVKMTEEVIAAAKEYNVSNIKLCGVRSYTLGIKYQLAKSLNTEFENNNITIEVM